MTNIAEVIDRVLPGLPGWCEPERGKRYATLVKSLGAKLVVELGVFGGRSLVSLGLGAQANGGRAIGIDPYSAVAALDHDPDPVNDEWWSKIDYEAIRNAALAGIANAGLKDVAEIRRMTSVDAAASFVDGSIDVLHQDSNHSERCSVAEVELWVPKMKPAGVWIMDDIGWTRRGENGENIPTMTRAQTMLEERGFALTEMNGQWAVYRHGAERIIGGPHLGGAIHDNGGDQNTWMPDIWEKLIRDYDIKSVVDVGCGAGFTTKWFKERLGDVNVIGIEGDPVAIEKRQCDVIQRDYTLGEYDPRRDFDLGWCAEFVEHVEERYMPNWMATLSNCKFVAMTFATPGQGGYHHVNERDEEYWIRRFSAYGFELVPEVTAWMRSTSKGEAWGRPTLTFFRNIYKGIDR